MERTATAVPAAASELSPVGAVSVTQLNSISRVVGHGTWSRVQRRLKEYHRLTSRPEEEGWGESARGSGHPDPVHQGRSEGDGLGRAAPVIPQPPYRQPPPPTDPVTKLVSQLVQLSGRCPASDNYTRKTMHHRSANETDRLGGIYLLALVFNF